MQNGPRVDPGGRQHAGGDCRARTAFADRHDRPPLPELVAVIPYEAVGDVAAARDEPVVALVELADVDHLDRVLGQQALELVHLDRRQRLGLGTVEHVAAQLAETDGA